MIQNKYSQTCASIYFDMQNNFMQDGRGRATRTDTRLKPLSRGHIRFF